jgi:hypothetical protein
MVAGMRHMQAMPHLRGLGATKGLCEHPRLWREGCCRGLGCQYMNRGESQQNRPAVDTSASCQQLFDSCYVRRALQCMAACMQMLSQTQKDHKHLLLPSNLHTLCICYMQHSTAVRLSALHRYDQPQHSLMQQGQGPVQKLTMSAACRRCSSVDSSPC